MKASIVTTTAQAPANLPAPVQALFLSEFSQATLLPTSAKPDADLDARRATQVTMVLKNILARTGYTHGGIND